MTKVEAIEQLMRDNGGTANWALIYKNICKYYPAAKDSKDWEAGLRGVLYREIKNKRHFKKIGLSIYALADYEEQLKPTEEDRIRMHSYIEGICIELGNLMQFNTYTADPTALYRDNLQLNSFVTIHDLPLFSYPQILTEARRIDVIWLNKSGLQFPQKVFEIVDSVSTLTGAFNRSLQLKNFNTEFYVVAPQKHYAKYKQTLDLEIYQQTHDRFKFINYENIINFYEIAAKYGKLESKIFG